MTSALFHDFYQLPPETKKLQRINRSVFRSLRRAFVPKHLRQNIAAKADLAHQAHLASCWREFISNYLAGKFEIPQITPKQQLATQKIIWQYWGQGIDGDLPEIVRTCFASVDKHCQDYIVIRLDDNSIHDYLDMPDFINKKRQNPEFKYAFFADLIRLALLKHYGGIWVDATILLTAPMNENLLNQDFFMFQRDAAAQNQNYWQSFNSDYFGWDKHHHVNALNSFIIAKKDNEVITHCLNILLLFWRDADHIPHYFFFQIMFDVLIHEFLADDNCPVIDDTLPHLLISKLNERFDEAEYRNILGKTSIHKLTYLKQCRQGSYYEYLKSQL